MEGLSPVPRATTLGPAENDSTILPPTDERSALIWARERLGAKRTSTDVAGSTRGLDVVLRSVRASRNSRERRGVAVLRRARRDIAASSRFNRCESYVAGGRSAA